MPNELASPSFQSTRQTVSELKETAADGVRDLTRLAAVHTSKAKGQLNDLAGRFREKGKVQIKEVQAKMSDLIGSARTYATARPIACIGVALVVGFLFGLSRRSSSLR